MSVFEKVEMMNRKIVKVPVREIGPIQDRSELDCFIGCLREEIEEFEAAIDQDFIGQVDAIIDLIYFAAGGLTRMGIPSDLSQKIFSAVHGANMSKTKGVKEERSATHTLDAVKPEGWVGPEERIAQLIEDQKNAKTVRPVL